MKEKQQQLHEYLELTGKSLKAFAVEIGMTPHTMSLYNTGAREIPKHLAWGISQAMKLIKTQAAISGK